MANLPAQRSTDELVQSLPGKGAMRNQDGTRSAIAGSVIPDVDAPAELRTAAVNRLLDLCESTANSGAAAVAARGFSRLGPKDAVCIPASI